MMSKGGLRDEQASESLDPRSVKAACAKTRLVSVVYVAKKGSSVARGTSETSVESNSVSWGLVSLEVRPETTSAGVSETSS